MPKKPTVHPVLQIAIILLITITILLGLYLIYQAFTFIFFDQGLAQIRLRRTLPVPNGYHKIIKIDKSWSTVMIRSLNGYIPTDGEDDLNKVFDYYKNYFSTKGKIQTYLNYEFTVDCKGNSGNQITVSKLEGTYVSLDFDNLSNFSECGL